MSKNIIHHEGKIILLTEVILSLCEEQNLNKEVVADNFVFKLLGRGYDISKEVKDD